MDTIEGETYPRTLVLGTDAVRFVRGILQEKLKEMEAWEAVSITSDFEEGEDA